MRDLGNARAEVDLHGAQAAWRAARDLYRLIGHDREADRLVPLTAGAD